MKQGGMRVYTEMNIYVQVLVMWCEVLQRKRQQLPYEPTTKHGRISTSLAQIRGVGQCVQLNILKFNEQHMHLSQLGVEHIPSGGVRGALT